MRATDAHAARASLVRGSTHSRISAGTQVHSAVITVPSRMAVERERERERESPARTLAAGAKFARR